MLGAGRSNVPNALVPNVLRDCAPDGNVRKVNLACDNTKARTICAANAGGHPRNAAEYPGSVCEIS